MAKQKKLESKFQIEEVAPILNPRGANREATAEVIAALGKVLTDRYVSEEADRYATNLILALTKGYEQQSGQKYL